MIRLSPAQGRDRAVRTRWKQSTVSCCSGVSPDQREQFTNGPCWASAAMVSSSRRTEDAAVPLLLGLDVWWADCPIPSAGALRTAPSERSRPQARASCGLSGLVERDVRHVRLAAAVIESYRFSRVVEAVGQPHRHDGDSLGAVGRDHVGQGRGAYSAGRTVRRRGIEHVVRRRTRPGGYRSCASGHRS